MEILHKHRDINQAATLSKPKPMGRSLKVYSVTVDRKSFVVDDLGPRFSYDGDAYICDPGGVVFVAGVSMMEVASHFPSAAKIVEVGTAFEPPRT